MRSDTKTGLRNDIVKSKKHLARNIVILVISILFLVGGFGCIYADQLLGKIRFVAEGESSAGSQVDTGDLFEPPAESGVGKDNAKAGLIGGLYHDDAVTNILLLGVDDWQVGDSGRSDSMMLVSIDSRHKKMKVTSFMRDIYAAIPGLGSHKLTEAYSLGGGKADGARKILSTIEANFGVDIDRFVTVDYEAFPKIIDRLGGVEIELTDETNADGITEAGLINAYSGETGHPVHTGKNTLTGLQARYYSRIRDIGNDFERTARQRKVFASIVGKLKTASPITVNAVLADILPLVSTNMTKDEIVSLAGNALTYLNYPLIQHRVPADGEWYRLENDAGDCIGITDLEKTKQNFVKFIFEDDIPSGDYS